MRHEPLHPPIGDRPGPSGPRTLPGFVAFTLLTAFVVGTVLVPALGLATIAATAAVGLGRALYRRREAGPQSPADASPPETQLHAD
jgi:hypothetical protein